MKSSKHVETCFVRANNDFDDKLTAFWMKNNFWTKIPKNGHCAGPEISSFATGATGFSFGGASNTGW